MKRYIHNIRSIRIYCPNCRKVVNPILVICNTTAHDGDAEQTTRLQFECISCKTDIATKPVVAHNPAERTDHHTSLIASVGVQ